MIRWIIPGLATLAVTAAIPAGANHGPRALPPAMGGLWEVSQRADGHGAQRVSVRDPRYLLEWEHRRARCSQRLLANGPTSAVVQYDCGPAGFGHSKLTLVTPRTIKVETQGIANSYPFKYTLHARRLGNCPAR